MDVVETGSERLGLMKRHERAVVGDLNQDGGDLRLICQKQIIGVDISRTGRGTHDEAKFRLESSQGLSGIQAQKETTLEDIMGAIKVI